MKTKPKTKQTPVVMTEESFDKLWNHLDRAWELSTLTRLELAGAHALIDACRSRKNPSVVKRAK